jgi:hypothetical protein
LDPFSYEVDLITIPLFLVAEPAALTRLISIAMGACLDLEMVVLLSRSRGSSRKLASLSSIDLVIDYDFILIHLVNVLCPELQMYRLYNTFIPLVLLHFTSVSWVLLKYDEDNLVSGIDHFLK